MKSIRRMIIMALLVSAGFATRAEEVPDEALDKAVEAVLLMDEGQIDRSIEILDSLHRVYPDNYGIAYEIAYGYYAKEDFKRVISLLIPLLSNPECNAKSYGMLGNAYHIEGDVEKAVETYNKGIELFPDDGYCYNELASLCKVEGRFGEAYKYYNDAIVHDPAYSSPYFWDAVMCLTECGMPVMGMLYADAFTLLDPESPRVPTAGSMILATQRNIVTRNGDKSFSINIAPGAMDQPSTGLEMLYVLGAAKDLGEKDFDLDNLSNVIKYRSECLDNIVEYRDKIKMVDYLFKIREAGHWEAFCVWQYGDEFEKDATFWTDMHPYAIAAFNSWYQENPFTPDTASSIGLFALGI